jgi:hypothetical protein
LESLIETEESTWYRVTVGKTFQPYNRRMNQRAESGIFPPVKLSFLEERLFSIQISPEAEIQEELERSALEYGVNVAYQARYALTLYRESFMTQEDHAKDNIAWYVRNFRPPKSKLSIEERNAITRRLHQEISELTTAATLGNLLVPQELHEFVKRKVELGEFSSPTDLLTAAMPFLRAQQGRSLRAEILDEDRYVLFG